MSDEGCLQFTEFKQSEAQPLELLAAPCIVKGKRHMLYGTGGKGKSTFTRALAATVSGNTQFFHQNTKPAIPILWGEEGTEDFNWCVSQMPQSVQDSLGTLYVFEHTECSIEVLGKRIANIRERHPDQHLVVIVDPIGYAVNQLGGTMNNNSEVIRACNTLFEACKDATLIAIHHQKKPTKDVSVDDPDSFQGSAYFKNLFDAVIRLVQDADTLTTTLTCEKVRAHMSSAMTITRRWHYDVENNMPIPTEATETAQPTKTDLIISRFQHATTPIRTKNDAIEGLGNRNEHLFIFNKMLERGEIIRDGKEYRLQDTVIP